jgi:hypothetical protein
VGSEKRAKERVQNERSLEQNPCYKGNDAKRVVALLWKLGGGPGWSP